MKTECEREELAFMPVAETARAAWPARSTAKMASGEAMATSVAPATKMPFSLSSNTRKLPGSTTVALPSSGKSPSSSGLPVRGAAMAPPPPPPPPPP